MSELRPNTTTARRHGSRWRLIAAGVLLVCVLHVPLLRGVSGLLVVDAPHADGDLLALRNEPESLAAVAALFTSGGFDRVLVIPNKPRHTDEMGITPSSIDEVRSELAARGVPVERIEAVAAATDGLRLRVREACRFATAHPERKVTFVADRFNSRAVQSRIAAELDAGGAARIAVASQPPLEFDERSWWTQRRAVQGVFRGYLSWVSAVWGGEAQMEVEPIDWPAFEAAVARGERP